MANETEGQQRLITGCSPDCPVMVLRGVDMQKNANVLDAQGKPDPVRVAGVLALRLPDVIRLGLRRTADEVAARFCAAAGLRPEEWQPTPGCIGEAGQYADRLRPVANLVLTDRETEALGAAGITQERLQEPLPKPEAPPEA